MTRSDDHNGKSRPFRSAARAGIVLIAASFATALALPAHIGELPEGMRTPVIAFELARTSDEVERMFGAFGSKERASYVQAMDRGNTVDFAFMIAYGAFLVLLAQALRRASPRAARIASWFTVIAVCADALENRRLFDITASLGGFYDDALRSLIWITWIKWSAIGCVIVLLIPGLLRHGLMGRVTSALAALCALATLLAFFHRGMWAEVMVHSLALTLLAAWIVALRAGASKTAV